MLAVGLVVLLAGYSAVYVGVERLRGDQRGVIDIWKGAGAFTPSSLTDTLSSEGVNMGQLGPKAQLYAADVQAMGLDPALVTDATVSFYVKMHPNDPAVKKYLADGFH